LLPSTAGCSTYSPPIVVTITQSQIGAQKDATLQQVLAIKGTKQKYRLTGLKMINFGSQMHIMLQLANLAH
jgi:hypothetical protein